MTTNTRSGVDGGEHSATLNCVMVGGVTQGQVRCQIVVMITRRSPPTSAAHTAANTTHFSRSYHAARHDVNDPIITSLGPPSARSTGVAHIMAC